MRCRCSIAVYSDAASQHEQIPKVPPCGVGRGRAHAHTSGGTARDRRNFSLTVLSCVGQQARVCVWYGTSCVLAIPRRRDAGRRRRANGSALTRRAVGAHVGASIYPTCYDYRISAQPIAIRDGFGALQIGFENSDPGPTPSRGRGGGRIATGGEASRRRAVRAHTS